MQTDSFDQTEVRLGGVEQPAAANHSHSTIFKIFQNFNLIQIFNLHICDAKYLGELRCHMTFAHKIIEYISESYQQKHFPLIAMKGDQHVQHEVYRDFVRFRKWLVARN